MSMISSLIDKLRKSADEWNGSNMFELARMCSDAADTIWQLRDDLQRANDENAKLRSELESVGTAAYLYGRTDLEAENAKLRELAHLVAEYTSADQCEGCVTKRACNAGELDMCWIRKAILEKLRELGIEVTE